MWLIRVGRDERATGRRRCGLSMDRMPHRPQWTLIVLRAWTEGDGGRIHILETDSDGGASEAVTASVREAVDVVSGLLGGLLPAGGPGVDGAVDGAQTRSET